MLRSFRVDVVEVRLPSHLDDISVLILPGGESTTLMSLLRRWNLVEPIRHLADSGVPIWGTCAGAILLSSEITEKEHRIEQSSLGLARVRAVRNAFGRQIHSFQEDLSIAGLSGPFPGVFIRAPFLEPLSPEVDVLCRVRESPVLLRDRNLWLSSFHPELTSDVRLHELFLRESGVLPVG
jgi:5'-phosphate synthase pdxT subunit